MSTTTRQNSFSPRCRAIASLSCNAQQAPGSTRDEGHRPGVRSPVPTIKTADPRDASGKRMTVAGLQLSLQRPTSRHGSGLDSIMFKVGGNIRLD